MCRRNKNKLKLNENYNLLNLRFDIQIWYQGYVKTTDYKKVQCYESGDVMPTLSPIESELFFFDCIINTLFNL